MGSLTSMIQNLRNISMKDVIENSVLDTAPDAVKLQKEQMMKGLRKTGKRIGKYKNPSYARKKYAMSPLAGYGFKDLRLTGDFQGSMGIDAQDTGVVFTSSDPKTMSIVEREGSDIFGLTKESSETYSIKSIAPVATKRIKDQIHK